jgi:predicted Ser/Thr protein kinase
MSGQSLPTLSDLPPLVVRRLELICTRFEQGWARGHRPAIEEHLPQVPEEARGVLLTELLRVELGYRLRAGEVPRSAEYRERFPKETALVDAAFAAALLAKPEVDTARKERSAAEESLASSPQPATLSAAAVTPGPSPVPPQPDPDDPFATRQPTVQGPPRDAATAGLVAVPGYEVLGLLGKGGMGVVYKARQAALNRLVALKMILHAEHADADDRRRFRSEAQAVARLHHPNIVQIYEVGEANGSPYFSLEFCAGGNLEERLDGTPWEAPPAAQLMEVLARAMDAAHVAGIIHRDLKPANVLLSQDGVPKITDFGLAKRLDASRNTRSGAVMGTPSYMAPEQAGGWKVGPAADVYSLGALLYELLTGRPPFKAATTMETLRLVLSEEPVAVRRLQPKVPRDLETVCHKCLEKESRKRYPSALALADDLKRFLNSEPIEARRVQPWERAAKWMRRRPAAAALIGVLIAVAVALPIAAWQFAAQSAQRREAEQKRRDEAQAAEQKRQDAARAEARDFLARGQTAASSQAWQQAEVLLARRWRR